MTLVKHVERKLHNGDHSYKVEVYRLHLPQGKDEHDIDYDLMSPVSLEEGTKAVGVLSAGTDTTVITSFINHGSSKG